ncbi:hypothetical protein C9J48_00890 [Photobacterium profundum]|uniref:Uncharacterized protein n=1 Tax=Photobacterium profundum 3TCK TaxID=314280 RepID=Q1YZ87_9GAMM|nr:hypothetical protein P3TCK_18389 [Photobacterium profundum 3TCK]PSV64058.1 hypothetical protein C9J48_00890 [Photobacterium profundum]
MALLIQVKHGCPFLFHTGNDSLPPLISFLPIYSPSFIGDHIHLDTYRHLALIIKKINYPTDQV